MGLQMERAGLQDFLLTNAKASQKARAMRRRSCPVLEKLIGFNTELTD